MNGRWPFRKTNVDASSSKVGKARTKAKVPPPKKEQNWPYFS
jgi:hypothetical protein